MAGFIRSIDFTVGPDRIRFTVQTDINERFDYRRRRLESIIYEYSQEEFIELGQSMYEHVRDRTFVFYETNENGGELGSVLFQLGGEITVTRDWTAVNSFDIFMNIVFFNQALGNRE